MYKLYLTLAIIISAIRVSGQNAPAIVLECGKMTAYKLEGIRRNFGFNITVNLADTDSFKTELILAKKDSPKYKRLFGLLLMTKAFQVMISTGWRLGTE